MRWRDTVKLFQMAGSDRGGQRGLAEEMRMGRRETRGPAERESVLNLDDNQFWITSRSGRKPLEQNAGGAAQLDTDGCQSAGGSKQKMWGYLKRSNHVQNNGIELNDWCKVLWIKRMLQKGRDRKYLPFLFHKDKKNVNALLKLIAIAHRKWISEEKTFLKH